MTEGKKSGLLCKALAFLASATFLLCAVLSTVAVLRHTGAISRSCATGTLDVKGMGLLNGVYTDGTNTRMLLRPALDQVKVVTVDTCSGKLLGALTLAADTPEALAAAQQAEQQQQKKQPAPQPQQ